MDIPAIGVVKPGAKSAVENTTNKRIGIIGTEGTINSELYTQYIHSIDSEVTVFGKACPLFVPLVEEECYMIRLLMRLQDDILMK